MSEIILVSAVVGGLVESFRRAVRAKSPDLERSELFRAWILPLMPLVLGAVLMCLFHGVSVQAMISGILCGLGSGWARDRIAKVGGTK